MTIQLFTQLLGGIVFLICLAATPGHADMTVHFIDVGQGGGVLVQKNGKTIMYDCGDIGAGKDVVDYLDTFDVKNIDMMIISHAHQDHMGGCIAVLKSSVAVKNVYHNGSTADTKIWKKFKKVLQQKVTQNKTKVHIVKQDTTEDGLEILVAYDSHGEFIKEADNSILVRLVDDQVKILLTGDCEKPCEKEIASTSPVDATVLNVGHHGSEASSSQEFLSKVSPLIAVVSAGEGNRYGHPKAAVLDRLNQVNAEIYRTDFNGSVVIRSDGKKVRVETEK